MTLNEISYAIIGAAMKVHRALGPGLLESAYETCLEYELRKLGLTVERQKPIPVVYEEMKLDCGFRADLFVNNQIIVECKAKDQLHPIDTAQVLSHLRLLNRPLGLLINFHELNLQDGIKRIVNGFRET
jgi:GxxExxY protein